MRLRADQLIETLRSRRAELVPLVPELIFAGRDGLPTPAVSRRARRRSPVCCVRALNSRSLRRQRSSTTRSRSSKSRREQGRAFDITQGGVSLSVMQPAPSGVVPASRAPPEEPREQPASNEPESIDLVGSQPAPSAASAVTIEDLSTGERREVESRPAAAQPEPTPPAPQPSCAADQRRRPHPGRDAPTPRRCWSKPPLRTKRLAIARRWRSSACAWARSRTSRSKKLPGPSEGSLMRACG